MDFRNCLKRVSPALCVLVALLAPAIAQQSASTQTPAPPAQSQPEPALACGCEDKPLPAVLATVNGVRIMQADIIAEVRQRVADLQQQVTAARRHELDLQINSILLAAEAKRRGVSTEKLLEAEIVAKAQAPTEADAQKFYDENRARIRHEFKDVKADIIAFLREQREGELAAKFSAALRAAAQVQQLAAEATPPVNEADRARLLATVNGQRITVADIEDALRPLVFSVQSEVYRLRRQNVELRINELLLSQEAQRRSVTPNALLATEVDARTPVITETDAQKFYNENKEHINGEFAQVKDQIVPYLREQEAQKLSDALAARLRAGAQIETFLTPPTPPTYKIATDDQPTKGDARAAVTLIEFTDYQCPVCAQTQPVLERIVSEYGDRLRLVVRDYPLARHADAERAAEAAEAAREQGKYWEYTALLFQNQQALKVQNLKEYAAHIGLDRARFDAALNSGKFSDSVRRDVLDGARIGVAGTPTIFLNGRQVSDFSYEGLKAAIEAALKGRTVASAR